MDDIKHLDTEKRNKNSMNLSSMNSLEIVSLINEEDKKVAYAIENNIQEIAKAIEVGASVIKDGGKVIYVGAGTSGRLGVLDAVECPPTFGVNDDVFVGLIAGGEKAFIKAKEGAEDSKELAIEDLKNINITNKDIVVGIAASGRTPYVIGALEYANSVGAYTVALSTTSNSKIGDIAQNKIEVLVGAEVLTGSTRMKSGTAQKMVLNMISTGIMVLNGKVYENLMVDVKQTNEKLQSRAINIIVEATSVPILVAEQKLVEADNNVKLAIVMIINNYNKEEAQNHLLSNNGFI